MEFKSEPWKYESFTSYDNIYIDIKEKLYKVNIKNFKSLTKKKSLFANEKITQTNIYVKQQFKHMASFN